MLRRIVRVIGLLIIVGIILYLTFATLSQPMPDHPFFETDEGVLVIAHQGGDGLRPSNTMAAFQFAADLGVDVLEMDIHSTSDGVLVVIHDDTLDRTTDGTGRIRDYTFAELQAFDAGYHWPTLAEESEREDRPYRGQGITIPALREIFEAFPEYRMNIEIKQREPSIAAPLCELLREYSLAERVLVASFHPQSINEFREACPEVTTSGVEPEITLYYALNTVLLGAAYQPTAHAFQVPRRFGDLPVLTPQFVRGAAQHNVDIHAWTINDAATMREMIDLGVDGIITDYPDVLLGLLGR